MIIPELIDIIDAECISNWREEIEKADECGYKKEVFETKAELKAVLDEENKILANRFINAVDNFYDFAYYQISKQLFFFAFKAGMEMQKALDVED